MFETNIWFNLIKLVGPINIFFLFNKIKLIIILDWTNLLIGCVSRGTIH